MNLNSYDVAAKQGGGDEYNLKIVAVCRREDMSLWHFVRPSNHPDILPETFQENIKGIMVLALIGNTGCFKSKLLLCAFWRQLENAQITWALNSVSLQYEHLSYI